MEAQGSWERENPTVMEKHTEHEKLTKTRLQTWLKVTKTLCWLFDELSDELSEKEASRLLL